MKKKLLVLLMCVLISVSVCSGVLAANVGDIVNQAVYTDIIARINNYDIASYNINGYTAVVAEDLRNYGFDVQWNDSERSLYITRANTSDVTSIYEASKVPASQCGKKAYDVLYTDIKTYINGNCVNSYNIGGKTIIYIDDLKAFGAIKWDEKSRVISLTVDGLEIKNLLANLKLSRNDIEINLKPSGSEVLFVNRSDYPYKFSVMGINGGLVMRPFNRNGDVVINPGETKLVYWAYDKIYNTRGTNHGLNSYGYVVITWNGKQYYADFTVNGITNFYRGNARGPIAE